MSGDTKLWTDVKLSALDGALLNCFTWDKLSAAQRIEKITEYEVYGYPLTPAADLARAMKDWEGES